MIEHTNTRATTTGPFALQRGFRADDHVYGVNQYLFYRLNPCLAAGMRFEWLAEVLTIEQAQLGRLRAPVNLYALSWGLNWTPGASLLVRPEIRWDWSDRAVYDEGSASDQVLLAVDAVWRF